MTFHSSLPSEIMMLITRFLTWDSHAQTSLDTLYIPKKAAFPSSFSSTCKLFRQILISEWFYLLKLESPQDWTRAQQIQITGYIRIMIVAENALVSNGPRLNFSHLENIRIMTLDCHNDVGCSSSNKGQWSYKKVIPRLPGSLKSLVVLNAHGPDLQVIKQAVEQCPDLEDLCLGRCTKFNRLNNCDFWNKFPDDHDSYFSNKGVDGYAKALGTELKCLKRLKSIYVNVYLTDTKYLSIEDANVNPASDLAPAISEREQVVVHKEITLTDRALQQLEPAQEASHDYQDPQGSRQNSSEDSPPMKNDQDVTLEAELSAANTLFNCHNTLCNVAFVSYWTPSRLGWSIHSRGGYTHHLKSTPQPESRQAIQTIPKSHEFYHSPDVGQYSKT
ncbi:F-box-like domain protein [Ceratobasidium sp. AG-Ba]|nr:F-box-like domain protein [Ceratobasidium sp. AG-Ba]